MVHAYRPTELTDKLFRVIFDKEPSWHLPHRRGDLHRRGWWMPSSRASHQIW